MVAVAERELLTVAQLAAEWQVSERTVLNYLRAGRLEGYRLGGPKAGWRIPREAVDRFLAGARGGGVEPESLEERSNSE